MDAAGDGCLPLLCALLFVFCVQPQTNHIIKEGWIHSKMMRIYKTRMWVHCTGLSLVHTVATGAEGVATLRARSAVRRGIQHRERREVAAIVLAGTSEWVDTVCSLLDCLEKYINTFQTMLRHTCLASLICFAVAFLCSTASRIFLSSLKRFTLLHSTAIFLPVCISQSILLCVLSISQPVVELDGDVWNDGLRIDYVPRHPIVNENQPFHRIQPCLDQVAVDGVDHQVFQITTWCNTKPEMIEEYSR